MRLRNGHPDRRRQSRGTGDTEPARPQLVSLIIGTFREMPGLCLYESQAAPLFGLRATTCHVVMQDLVAQGKLRRAADGQYASGDPDRFGRAGDVELPAAETYLRGIARRGR